LRPRNRGDTRLSALRRRFIRAQRVQRGVAGLLRVDGGETGARDIGLELVRVRRIARFPHQRARGGTIGERVRGPCGPFDTGPADEM
jgi:hypothetical protein